MNSSTSSPRAFEKHLSSPQIVNPHFFSTRSDAALSFAARAKSGRSSIIGPNAVSAAVASYRGDEEGTKEDMLRALKSALVHAWAQGGDRVEVPKDAWNH